MKQSGRRFSKKTAISLDGGVSIQLLIVAQCHAPLPKNFDQQQHQQHRIDIDVVAEHLGLGSRNIATRARDAASNPSLTHRLYYNNNLHVELARGINVCSLEGCGKMRGIISGLGAAGGALLLYSALREKKKVAASWTVPHVPPEELHPKWDYNWDR